jgi:hypothetical protein
MESSALVKESKYHRAAEIIQRNHKEALSAMGSSSFQDRLNQFERRWDTWRAEESDQADGEMMLVVRFLALENPTLEDTRRFLYDALWCNEQEHATYWLLVFITLFTGIVRWMDLQL